MVTGVSFNFHAMELAIGSESSQWWRSMSAVVIFGLVLATVLTLIVVPVIYELIEKIKVRLALVNSEQ